MTIAGRILSSVGRAALVLYAGFVLQSCGGTGSTASKDLVSVPTPPASPQPAPPGSALEQPQEFATFGVSAFEERDDSGSQVIASQAGPAEVSFRYLGEGQGYQIELPGYRSGNLDFTYEINGSDRFTITDEAGALLDAVVFLHAQGGSVRYTYTDLAFWIAGADDPRRTETGYFVYGVPTDQAEIPRTGRGQYQAQVFGQTGLHNDVGGSATLEFDFTGGRLTGYMDPVLLNKTGFGFDTVLPRYEFIDTVYASGSTRFSGRFEVAGSTSASAFEGIFAGPGAAELMARWYAPFRHPGSQEWGTMFGVWIGKKD